MKKLVYEMKQLCHAHHDGSYATQKKRQHVLLMVARQLSDDLGYRGMAVSSLKPKHVEALLKLWRSQGISVATLKARMSHLRWWSQKVQKQNVIARTNQHYGIGRRRYVTETSKAVDVERKQIDTIKDDYVRASVMLAKVFGLRKEEAIKIIPTLADKGDTLFLQASWCKGGRERSIPILTDEQRAALDEAKHIAGSGSLIPAHLRYHQQRSRYESITAQAGLRKLHGLRHHYAQVRYRELTGWECPHQGGPKRRSLNLMQKQLDRRARLIISNEVGHKRISIVANYIG